MAIARRGLTAKGDVGRAERRRRPREAWWPRRRPFPGRRGRGRGRDGWHLGFRRYGEHWDHYWAAPFSHLPIPHSPHLPNHQISKKGHNTKDNDEDGKGHRPRRLWGRLSWLWRLRCLLFLIQWRARQVSIPFFLQVFHDRNCLQLDCAQVCEISQCFLLAHDTHTRWICGETHSIVH